MLIPFALTVLTVTTLRLQAPNPPAGQTGGAAQSATQPPQSQPPQSQPSESEESDSQTPRSDRAVDPSQPDFTLVGLPTTLRVPRFRSAFRVTHRFTRSLGRGSFGDLLGDFFGFDSGAQIGLEYRFGIMTGTQVGIHRTSDRTIELFAQHQVLRQGTRLPVSVDALAAIEGANNLREHYSPSLGAVISRTFGRHGTAYVEPIWVNNTNPLPGALVDHNSTFMIGVGARARVRPTVYLVAEVTPRVGGYQPLVNQASFALEKRAGGHTFQINFSNGFGTTLGQIARGGVDSHSWFIGFNLSRKFF